MPRNLWLERVQMGRAHGLCGGECVGVSPAAASTVLVAEAYRGSGKAHGTAVVPASFVAVQKTPPDHVKVHIFYWWKVVFADWVQLKIELLRPVNDCHSFV